MRRARWGWLALGLAAACGPTSTHNGTHDAGSAAVDAPVAIDAGSAAVDAPVTVDAGSARPDAPSAVDAGSAQGDAGAPCDPLAQTGCGSAQKCTWIIDSNAPSAGHDGCAFAGGVPTGGACVFSNADATGFDNCVAGDICINGLCEAICGLGSAAPTCDTAHACVPYDGVFGAPGSASTAGACDPACDPLTQVTGSGAAACGSTTATNPDRGCYTTTYQAFSCAGSPAGRGVTAALTDRVACTAAAGCATSTGALFSNGCAPGFVPFLQDSTASTQVDCTGLCAPLDTDLTTPGNGPGDPAALGKLPGDPAPVAGHARCTAGGRAKDANEECHYLSAFQITGPFADTLGVCFEPSQFMYDSNGDGTVDTVWPACATLRAGTPGAGDDPTTFAVTFGCYKSTHTLRGAPVARVGFLAPTLPWRRPGGVR